MIVKTTGLFTLEYSIVKDHVRISYNCNNFAMIRLGSEGMSLIDIMRVIGIDVL